MKYGLSTIPERSKVPIPSVYENDQGGTPVNVTGRFTELPSIIVVDPIKVAVGNSIVTASVTLIVFVPYTFVTVNDTSYVPGDE